jgi:hypothetical protein
MKTLFFSRSRRDPIEAAVWVRIFRRSVPTRQPDGGRFRLARGLRPATHASDMAKHAIDSKFTAVAAIQYGIAAAAVLVATGVRLALEPAIGPYAPYLPFVLAVIVVARYCGRWASLAATALSSLSCMYFFLEPQHSFVKRDPAVLINLLVFMGVAVSISFLVGNLRAAMASSRRSEERFRRLFDSMDEGFASCRMIYDGAGKAVDFEYLEVNPAFGRLTGIPIERVPGHCARELIPGIEPALIETYDRVVRSGQSERFCQSVATLGRLFAISAFRIGPQEFAAVFTEISEKRRAEEDLLFLAAIVESSDDAIIGESLDGTVRSWNPSADRLYGYTAAEMIGQPFQLLIAEDRHEESHANARRIRAGTHVYHHETVRHRKNGTRVDISLTESPVFDNAGTIIGVSRITRDITEQKRVEGELRLSEERYRVLVTASSDAIYRFNPDWRELRYLRGGEFIGNSEIAQTDWLQKYIYPEDQPGVVKLIQGAIHSGGKFEMEHRVVRADGSVGWTFSRAVPLRGASGEILEWVGTAADITDRKRAEDSIRDLNATLELRVEARTAELAEANRELESFAYSVSHDLRAPLRAVEGFANILLRDYPGKLLDETAAGYMRRMGAASRRMGDLIAELLNLSRLGRQEMNRRSVNLSEMAEAILSELRDHDPQRQVAAGIEPRLIAQADPKLMHVVLENLLGNAWKYTGKTTDATIHFGIVSGQAAPTFFVRDNGAGFDMRHADVLFAPFQRLHRSDEFEGNGIGLATVQRVIRRHGGRIWAEAKPNEGAAFYFTLGES